MLERARFESALDFDLDPFQRDALDALDRGRSVVVAAPTGSGKTVVAEYAIARALAEGAKAFYTTPLKALSNQKYAEAVRRHGPDRVGLLTGDNAINGDAPVVVMTTEVLRNMIYAGSRTLEGLRYVILDEVHYLQNAYRGPVWEEVIIHAPPAVDLVCLSATVSNADELADWIRTVRGETEVVIEERRPVALHDRYLVGDRASPRPLLLPTLVEGRPNPEALTLDARSERLPAPGRRRRGRLYSPHRSDTVDLLRDEGMLPAIHFIFSRKACDDAVVQCVRDGLRLTTPEERRLVREIVERHVDGIGDEDLRLLGYGEWLTGLEAGFAAHHAGLVPPFKEAVEECFAAGGVKVVFATETLSLGINMPARSVVVEKLTKFTGEHHEFLTPGEYAQLTGRAGRRGIDEVGYAVVLWSPFVSFEQVAALAATRSYALTSSFRPTYNMAVNLVRRYPADVAHHLLNLSFAQYRADSDVVRLETQLERTQTALAEARSLAACERGDVAEYRALVRAAEDGAERSPARSAEIAVALERVQPGDVLMVPGRRGGRVAVLTTTRHRGGDIRVRAITPERRVVSLGPRDFPYPPQPVARVTLPAPYAPRNAGFQRRVASSLVAARVDLSRSGSDRRHRQRRRSERGPEAAAHPVAGCPDLRGHLRALERAERLAREVDRVERRIKGRTESLARQFDRVLGVLEAWGYVEGWGLTAAGERLSRIYHEADLLVAETVESGLLDGLSPAELAGLVSAFTFEARSGGEGTAPPGGPLRSRWAELEALTARLNAAEDQAGLPLTRGPDPGFCSAAARWAAGDDLADVLEDLSGGDFVRNVKQLIDLLRQLGAVAPGPATAAAARSAAGEMFRGVVAASSVTTG
ncbi:MAG TPA: DEAD/DEAH box helicase [Acidimicrobiales bacterium]|nr:DEAD/DEAH box helicase [Acidimicrobiales bacterium]